VYCMQTYLDGGMTIACILPSLVVLEGFYDFFGCEKQMYSLIMNFHSQYLDTTLSSLFTY